MNGKKQRIITHESREWVWEIERLKDRERERERTALQIVVY